MQFHTLLLYKYVFKISLHFDCSKVITQSNIPGKTFFFVGGGVSFFFFFIIYFLFKPHISCFSFCFKQKKRKKRGWGGAKSRGERGEMFQQHHHYHSGTIQMHQNFFLAFFFMVIVFLLTNPSHVLKYDDITRQPYRNLIDSSLHIISILPRRKCQHNNNNNNILIVVAMVVIREEMTLMIHNMQNHWDLSMVCFLLLLFKMKRTLVGREIY